MKHPVYNSKSHPDEIFEKLFSLENRISKLEGILLKGKHLTEFQASESDENETDVPFYRRKAKDD